MYRISVRTQYRDTLAPERGIHAKDYIVHARTIDAAERMVRFDLSTPSRKMPRYPILGMDSQVISETSDTREALQSFTSYLVGGTR